MSIDLREIEQFLFREAGLLDAARFDDWLALFTDTAWYWVPISRIVGNVMVEAENSDGADIVVSSRFQMAEFRRDRQRIFAGCARHGLVKGGGGSAGGFRIAWKRVDLVNCDGMLDGITVPV